MYILNFIRGFCMALADSVPGVSGGTIAFILGFYDDFVNSLNNLISGDKLDRINAFKFLSKIGIGWVVGFILSVLFITNIFEKNIYEINSLFLGFIISSIPLIVKSERKTLKNNKKNILAMGISIAEKVLRRNFEDEESMDLLILDVIKEYELKENFVIRVNPIYKESLDKQILELKENNLINKDVFILSDESVDKGNALIESLNGKLVIGIDDVIGKIKEELL